MLWQFFIWLWCKFCHLQEVKVMKLNHQILLKIISYWMSAFAICLKNFHNNMKIAIGDGFFCLIEKNGSARQRTASPVLIELTTSIAWQRDLHGSVENCGAILVCLPFGRTICSWFSPLAWKNRGWFGCYSKNCSLACLPPTNHERSNSQRSVLVRSRTLFYYFAKICCVYRAWMSVKLIEVSQE